MYKIELQPGSKMLSIPQQSSKLHIWKHETIQYYYVSELK